MRCRSNIIGNLWLMSAPVAVIMCANWQCANSNQPVELEIFELHRRLTRKLSFEEWIIIMREWRAGRTYGWVSSSRSHA